MPCGVDVPLRMMLSIALGSVRIDEPAIAFAIPPSPAKPWHLAHTPVHSCFPRVDVPSVCAAFSAVSHWSNAPGRMIFTDASMFACSSPHSSAH